MNTEFSESIITNIAQNSISRESLWSSVVDHVKAKNIVEIGVWKAEFSRFILSGCSSIEKYYMIDPWENLDDWNKPFNVGSNEFEKIYDEAMSSTTFASEKIEVLRGKTKAVIDSIPNKTLDFSYIDGDHTLRGITIDLICLLPKIKDFGIIAGDDFNASPWQHSAEFEPTLIFPFAVFFAEAIDKPIYALPHNQFLIHNHPEKRFEFIDLTGSYGNLSINSLIQEQQRIKLKKNWLSRIASGMKRK